MSRQRIARRMRKKDRRLAAPSIRIHDALQEELRSMSAAFMNLSRSQQAEIHSTSMVCSQVRNHGLQRMDLHWNSALRRHLQSDRMPAIPAVALTSEAEGEYRTLSAVLEDRRAEAKEKSA